MNTNVLITAAVDYVRSRTNGFNLDFAVLEAGLQSALEAVLPRNIGLSSANPDFETILLQLVQELQNDDAWKDVITAGTGQTLLRNMASGLSSLHVAIMRATQENFVHLAQSDRAVFANTRFLGVNPQRRTPAQVTVRITAADFSGAFVIPPLSEFVINGVRYFNRTQVVYDTFNLTQTATLYEGTLYAAELVADGTPFESVTVGTGNGAISAHDVYVFVNGVAWTRIDHPWTAPANGTTFIERTDHNNVTVRFGNGVYGALLPAGGDVAVRWAETDGDRAAHVGVGVNVTAPFVNDNVTLTATTISPSIPGGAALGADVYRVMAPHMRSSDKTAIRRADFKSEAIKYPGVVDAFFQGQAELAPNRRSMMNYYSATVLTSTGVPMTDAEWLAFITWLGERCIDNLQWIRQDPYPIRVKLTADLYCNQEAYLQAAKTTIERDIRAALKPRLGSLGYSIHGTDIADLLEGNENSADPNIVRVVEYARNVKLAYSTPAAPFVDAAKYPNGGLVDDDLIMPTPRYYVALDSVVLTPFYTARGAIDGRRDL